MRARMLDHFHGSAVKKHPIYSLAYSDGVLASGSLHGSLKFLFGKETLHVNKQEGTIMSVCFSPCGKLLAAGSDDYTVFVYEINRENRKVDFKYRLGPHGSDVTAVAFLEDLLYVCDVSGHITAYADSKLKKKVKCLDSPRGMTICKKFRRLAVRNERSLEIYDTTLSLLKQKNIGDLKVYEFNFSRCSYSLEGNLAVALASNGKNYSIEILDQNLEYHISLLGHVSPAEVVSFCPYKFSVDNKSFLLLAIGAQDYSVSIWTTMHFKPFLLAKNITSGPILDLIWIGTTLLVAGSCGSLIEIEVPLSELGTIIETQSNENENIPVNFSGRNLRFREKGMREAVESQNNVDLLRSETQLNLSTPINPGQLRNSAVRLSSNTDHKEKLFTIPSKTLTETSQLPEDNRSSLNSQPSQNEFSKYDIFSQTQEKRKKGYQSSFHNIIKQNQAHISTLYPSQSNVGPTSFDFKNCSSFSLDKKSTDRFQRGKKGEGNEHLLDSNQCRVQLGRNVEKGYSSLTVIQRSMSDSEYIVNRKRRHWQNLYDDRGIQKQTENHHCLKTPYHSSRNQQGSGSASCSQLIKKLDEPAHKCVKRAPDRIRIDPTVICVSNATDVFNNGHLYVSDGLLNFCRPKAAAPFSNENAPFQNEFQEHSGLELDLNAQKIQQNKVVVRSGVLPTQRAASASVDEFDLQNLSFINRKTHSENSDAVNQTEKFHQDRVKNSHHLLSLSNVQSSTNENTRPTAQESRFNVQDQVHSTDGMLPHTYSLRDFTVSGTLPSSDFDSTNQIGRYEARSCTTDIRTDPPQRNWQQDEISVKAEVSRPDCQNFDHGSTSADLVSKKMPFESKNEIHLRPNQEHKERFHPESGVCSDTKAAGVDVKYANIHHEKASRVDHLRPITGESTSNQKLASDPFTSKIRPYQKPGPLQSGTNSQPDRSSVSLEPKKGDMLDSKTSKHDNHHISTVRNEFVQSSSHSSEQKACDFRKRKSNNTLREMKQFQNLLVTDTHRDDKNLEAAKSHTLSQSEEKISKTVHIVDKDPRLPSPATTPQIEHSVGIKNSSQKTIASIVKDQTSQNLPDSPRGIRMDQKLLEGTVLAQKNHTKEESKISNDADIESLTKKSDKPAKRRIRPVLISPLTNTKSSVTDCTRPNFILFKSSLPNKILDEPPRFPENFATRIGIYRIEIRNSELSKTLVYRDEKEYFVLNLPKILFFMCNKKYLCFVVEDTKCNTVITYSIITGLLIMPYISTNKVVMMDLISKKLLLVFADSSLTIINLKRKKSILNVNLPVEDNLINVRLSKRFFLISRFDSNTFYYSRNLGIWSKLSPELPSIMLSKQDNQQIFDDFQDDNTFQLLEYKFRIYEDIGSGSRLKRCAEKMAKLAIGLTSIDEVSYNVLFYVFEALCRNNMQKLAVSLLRKINSNKVLQPFVIEILDYLDLC